MPFQPGQSGNPGGRPKDNAVVRDLAREHTLGAIKALADALEDENSRVRVTAAEALLDRGWGKPAQTIGGDPDGAPVTFKGIVEFIRSNAG